MDNLAPLGRLIESLRARRMDVNTATLDRTQAEERLRTARDRAAEVERDISAHIDKMVSPTAFDDF